MNKEINRKKHNLAQRKNRIRTVISGTTERPRLTLTISNTHISAQIIDDSKSETITAASTVGKKQTGTLTEKATIVGKEIAKSATGKKVSTIVFDRNGKKFHGRVKAFADAAREGGLKF